MVHVISRVALFLALFVIVSAKTETPFHCKLSQDQQAYSLIANSDNPAAKNKYPCHVFTEKNPPPTANKVLQDKSSSEDKFLTEDVCSVHQKSTRTFYQREDDPELTKVWTGLMCKYECSESHFRCIDTPNAGDAKCPCRSTGIQASLVPIEQANRAEALMEDALIDFEKGNSEPLVAAQSGGTLAPISTPSEDEPNNPCSNMQIDDTFVLGPYAGRVDCMVFKGSTPRRDILVAKVFTYGGKKFSTCSAVSKDPTQYETFVKSEFSTGTQCEYGCRPSYRQECSEGDTIPTSDNPLSTCACEKRGGLKLKLLHATSDKQVEVGENDYQMPNPARFVVNNDGKVVIDASATCAVDEEGKDNCGACGKCVEGRCIPTNCGACANCVAGTCIPQDCGSCGKCVEKEESPGTSKCVLKESDPERSNLCPCGKICPPLTSLKFLDAHAPIKCASNPLMVGLPCMKRPGADTGNGTTIPDLCTESIESDVSDRCTCAKTHKEVLPELRIKSENAQSMPLCVPL